MKIKAEDHDPNPMLSLICRKAQAKRINSINFCHHKELMQDLKILVWEHLLKPTTMSLAEEKKLVMNAYLQD